MMSRILSTWLDRGKRGWKWPYRICFWKGRCLMEHISTPSNMYLFQLNCNHSHSYNLYDEVGSWNNGSTLLFPCRVPIHLCLIFCCSFCTYKGSASFKIMLSWIVAVNMVVMLYVTLYSQSLDDVVSHNIWCMDRD